MLTKGFYKRTSISNLVAQSRSLLLLKNQFPGEIEWDFLLPEPNCHYIVSCGLDNKY